MFISVECFLFIRVVLIFRELRDDFLVCLVFVMNELFFFINYIIFIEGKEGRFFYIVVFGKVKVYLEDCELVYLE